MPACTSKRIGYLMALGVVLGLSATALAVDTPNAASKRAADYLVAQQLGSGLWTNQPTGANFNGTMAAGLANYYNRLGGGTYRTAAENAGTGIINAGGGVYSGDEALALAEISRWQSNPTNNTWYNAVNPYLSSQTPTDLTNLANSAVGVDAALVYMSYLTRAAYELNTANRVNYRNEVVTLLGKLPDYDGNTTGGLPAYDGTNSLFPTRAVGAAVWALSIAGMATDTTPISGPAAVPPDGVVSLQVKDLPGFLANLQVTADVLDSLDPPEPHTFIGSFFGNMFYDATRRYTEDTAFAIMGLEAADMADPGQYAFGSQIDLARDVLKGAVPGTGNTFQAMDQTEAQYYLFSGETLEALPVPEAGSLCLLGLGVAGMLVRRRRSV